MILRPRLFSCLLITFLFLCVSVFQNAEAVCESEKSARDSAWTTLELRIAAHIAAQNALNLYIVECYRTGRQPSPEKLAALVAAEELARYFRNKAQEAYDEAQNAYSFCLRLHRHSCGCPSTNQNVSSCSCSWQSYRYGVSCPCYDS